MTIIISKPELFAAAARFTSTEQARPYLQGVAIEPCETGGAYIVATDGHRLFCGLDPEAQFIDGPAHNCLFQMDKKKLPIAAFKSQRLILDGTSAAFCEWYDDDHKPLAVDCLVAAPSIGHEWTFPNWRNVLPDVTADTVPQDSYAFNADYIADFGGVQKRLTGRKDMPFVARATGGNPALVSLGRDDCFGVIMPMRIGAAYDTGHDVAIDALRRVQGAQEPMAMAAE